MRKIKYAVSINPTSFQPIAKCKVKFDTGEMVTLFERELEAVRYEYLGKNFSEEEFGKITAINTALEEKGMIPMTLEEADYMLNWNKIPEVKDPDEIQRLAGFKVEKVITYLD